MVIDIDRSALVLVDIQNDFCPGGALAVSEGDQIIEPLNRLSARFAASGGRVVATQDWHPKQHVSFASAHGGARVLDTVSIPLPVFDDDRKSDDLRPSAVEQTLWPDHCVQGTSGAEFHPSLDTAPVTLIVRKGWRTTLDSYSAFFENDRRTLTGLDGWLKGLGIGTVFFGGLATDYCVFYSAMDAARLGYQTVVFTDACRGVGTPPGSVEKAIGLMREAGVHFMNSGDFR